MNINQSAYRTIWPDMANHCVHIIDQTGLPHSFEIRQITSVDQMIEAIKTMRVRGAPLIGVAAAYGLALACLEEVSDADLNAAAERLLSSRPTAVNLRWALERMMAGLMPRHPRERRMMAWQLASDLAEEDVRLNQAIAQHGARLLTQAYAQKKREIQILTHCNAGWLATVDWGTALGPIYKAFDEGVPLHVWVDETRPRNQGASLTSWELVQHGVPHTVIADNAGGHLMQHGEVDLVIVGADRVTRSGDVCNKIGTYLKALAAFDQSIPFYAAVPGPTIDWSLEEGVRDIPIEERDEDEVHWVHGLNDSDQVTRVRVTPKQAKALNPAFDVTPSRLVTGIITERGVFSPNALMDYHTKEAV